MAISLSSLDATEGSGMYGDVTDGDDGYGDEGSGFDGENQGGDNLEALAEALACQVIPYNEEDPDDGELHDGFNDGVAYTVREETYQQRTESEYLSNYQMGAAICLNVTYPQLEGEAPGIDQVNEAIRSTAMRFVEEEYVEQIPRYQSLMDSGLSDGFPVLACSVDYAISYNDDNLVSVCFNEHYLIGSGYAEFLGLATVNANIQTGEVYELEDVMDVDEQIARDWVQVMYDHGLQDTVDVLSEDAVVQGLMGQGDAANSFTKRFFVDQNGNVNLNVNFRVSSDAGSSHGWWDVTVPNDQVERVAKDSSFRDVLPKG